MLRAAADRERGSPVDHDLDCAFASWHRRAVRDEAEGNLCLDRGVHLRVSQSQQRDACNQEHCGVLRDGHFWFSCCEVLWRLALSSLLKPNCMPLSSKAGMDRKKPQ